MLAALGLWAFGCRSCRTHITILDAFALERMAKLELATKSCPTMRSADGGGFDFGMV